MAIDWEALREAAAAQALVERLDSMKARANNLLQATVAEFATLREGASEEGQAEVDRVFAELQVEVQALLGGGS